VSALPQRGFHRQRHAGQRRVVPAGGGQHQAHGQFAGRLAGQREGAAVEEVDEEGVAQQHWRAIAEGACEQCGRARVPTVGAVQDLGAWLTALPPAGAGTRLLLSLQPDAQPLTALVPAEASPVLTLSGPEGGLTPDEEAAARRAGFHPVALGPRVLRADTAPLAVLAWLGLQAVG
jgi:RsmE family RNA methyltransferase